MRGNRWKLLEWSRRIAPGSAYAVLALELAVVILGILLAFQIDRWAETRREHKQEYQYLVRLKEDLQLEIDSIDRAVEYAEARISAILLLEEAIANPDEPVVRPEALAEAIEMAAWRSYPQINAFVYTELQSTGNLALIRSESLRRNLAEHYASIRHYSRTGLDRDFQRHFDRLTAGILSTAELRGIEEGSWDSTTGNVSPQRAQELIRELSRRTEAVALLPGIAQHHVFNQKVMELARTNARELLVEIDSIIKQPNNG